MRLFFFNFNVEAYQVVLKLLISYKLYHKLYRLYVLKYKLFFHKTLQKNTFPFSYKNRSFFKGDENLCFNITLYFV